jgi:hypothetical protein
MVWLLMSLFVLDSGTQSENMDVRAKLNINHGRHNVERSHVSKARRYMRPTSPINIWY